MEASARQTVVFAIDSPIARADLPELCRRVCTVLGRGGAVAVSVAVCDVSSARPDAVTVDAVARLQLAVRRHGCEARLRGASSELLDLLTFMGLRDVLPD